jgi:hypothetical protein
MAVLDVLAQARTDISARLDELRPLVDEYARLEAAAVALAGVNGDTPRPKEATAARRRSAPSAPSRGRGRPKGSGKRADECAAIVAADPGITIPAIAERIGIKQNYLYRVLPALAEEGRVRKEGRGWVPVS